MTNPAKIEGSLVMIGLGSIGRGLLPLLERHFQWDRSHFAIVDPDDRNRAVAEKMGARFVKEGLKPDNYRQVLTPLLTSSGKGRSFCVNVSVDVCSIAIMELCNELDSHYIDTVNEPWVGFYFDASKGPEARSNYALRETFLAARKKLAGGVTGVSCCGANPGMVSWMVKQALVNLANDIGVTYSPPKTREDWAKLAKTLGVKGIHIAERDTQRSKNPKPPNVFINTWSVEGFISEGLQPAELGWGTHETWKPTTAREHQGGCGSAIYLLQPGGNTRVRTWTPTTGPHYGYLVTHNESISIADYFTLRDGENVVYRPTCHYAYHPVNDAVLSLHEMFGNNSTAQPSWHIMEEEEIIDGVDELGVLLYGHAKNAYWFGSQLSIEDTRKLAPDQNATGLQVTSAIIAGMLWAMENPHEGVVEVDEMDYNFCLQHQIPYLGKVFGVYTEWNPLKGRPGLFPEDLNPTDPWSFQNVLEH